MRPFVLMPSTVFREKAPFASEEEFKLFQEISPLAGFLAARPGTTLVRMSDVIADADLVETDFYRRFMKPHGDRFFACLCFWHSGVFQGMIGLHRTAAQRDFADVDLALLARLYPHFDTVFQQILSLHRERAVRLSLEQLLVKLPIATVLLDWDLRVSYRNQMAVELSALWRFGPFRARLEKHTSDFALPEAVLDYFTAFKSEWNPSHHRECPLLEAGGVAIRHPAIPGLRAVVNLLQLDAAPLSMPLFLVRLEHRSSPGEADGNGATDTFPSMARLSPRERDVARLVGQGCSNDEIASQLGKSVLTVKKQLRSVYEKLDLSGRGRLIAFLR